MAVWKRYNGKRIKGEGPKGKGTWIVEFRLRGHYVKQAIPEARTRAEAEQAQTKIKRDIFNDNTTALPAIKTSPSLLMKCLCRGRRHRSEVGRMTRSAQDR